MQGIASGAKAAQAQIENTASKLSAVNARLKEIQATNSTITSSYKSLSKTLGGSTATGQNATDLSAMKAKYIELETAVENLRNAKASATQEDIDNIYKLQSEMQSLMDATRQRIALEQQAAQAAQEAAKAEAAAAQEAAQAQKQEIVGENEKITAVKKYNDTLGKCNKLLKNYSSAQHSSNSDSVKAYSRYLYRTAGGDEIMEIENKGMELHVKVTADDVDQAVKDWFASRGVVASPRKWVKMSERKPGRSWLFLVSMLERENNVQWVIPAQWNAVNEVWESIQTGAQFREEEMEMVQAWMELPEPYRKDDA